MEQEQEKQSILIEELNKRVYNHELEAKTNNPDIKNNIFNYNLTFIGGYNYCDFLPADVVDNPLIERQYQNCRKTSRKLIKAISESFIDDKISNPYNEDDYRYNLFNEPTREQKEWFIKLISNNFKFDWNLYASQYPAGHEKWEDKENKACNIWVSRKKIPVTGVAITSPFIRVNSKNLFNNFVVDIDFPELKGNKKALKEKVAQMNKLFGIIKKVAPEFVPNVITYTSKGFQLLYVFEDTIIAKYKRDLLASIAKIEKEEICRRKRKKREAFYNDTIGTINRTLSELFNGDKFAIQTYTQGRVVRNPLVNSASFLSLEKKDLFACVKKLDSFTKVYKALTKEVVNPFEYNEEAVIEEKEEAKKTKKEKIYKPISALDKDDLKKLKFTVTENKEEFMEQNYTFLTEEEETIIKNLFLTYKLPAIDFTKTTGTGFRNVTIFTYGRYFAYELKKINNSLSEDELYDKLTICFNFLNRNFEKSLSVSELDVVMGSIVKFVQTRYNPNISVRENRKIAQLKSYKTKVTFAKDIVESNPFLTLKQLRAMSIKDIAKLTSVSYKTLLRWNRELNGILFKIVKEAQLNLAGKSKNIKVFFNEFKLRLITNTKNTIKQFYTDLKKTNLFFFHSGPVWEDLFDCTGSVLIMSL